jgi:hypothetical protein
MRSYSTNRRMQNVWTQLELFNEQTDIDFAMGLTTEQFVELKHRESDAYDWIKQIRHVVQAYQSMKKSLGSHFQHDLEIARAGPHTNKRY